MNLRSKHQVFFVALITAIVFQSELHANKAENCFKATELAELSQEFQFTSSAATLNPEAIPLCQTDSLVTHALSALQFLKTHQDLPPLPIQLTRPLIHPNAWDFVKTRIKTIQLNENGEGLCGQSTKTESGNLNVSAYVMPGNPTIFLCPFFSELELLAAASKLVHEARHVHGFIHVDCTRGPREGGAGACDSSYSDGGSYAIEAEYKLRLYKSKNLDPALRLAALHDGLYDLFIKFNQLPFGLKQALLIQEESGALLSWDGSRMRAIPNGSPGSVLVQRKESHVFFDRAQKKAVTYFLGNWLDSPGGIAHDFRDDSSKLLDEPIIDVLYGDSYSCILFEQALRCSPKAQIHEYIAIPLSQFRSIGFFHPPKSESSKNPTSFLLTQDGSLYEMPADLSDFKTNQPMEFKFAQKKISHKKQLILTSDAPTQTHQNQGTDANDKSKISHYALTLDGQLLQRNLRTQKFEPMPEFIGKKIRSIAPWITGSPLLEQL